MLQWLNHHENLNLNDLKHYKPSKKLHEDTESDEFQFDNGFICGEETGMAFLDESSSDEN